MIIKVMKKLKSCEFENMITEVLPLLRFNQQRSDVETRTEQLVTRGNLYVWDQKIDDAAGKEGKDQAMDVDEGEKAPSTRKMIKYPE